MVEARTNDGLRVELHENGTWTATEAAKDVASESSFRRVTWGASRAEVEESEGRSPDGEGANTLGFAVTVTELAATALYIFVSDTLVRAKYLITQPHSDDNLYLRDFATLFELLTVKYGQPSEKNEYWSNDLYRDSPQEYGMAVSAGHMSRYYMWSLSDTAIYLVLTGDNYEVSLQIEYVGREFEALDAAEQQKSSLNDL